MTTPPTDINQRIKQFVALRDKIKKLDDAHKETMKPFREMLETLGTIMLDHLKNVSADSVSTPSGTVYKTVKNSATIADGDAFWKYVMDNEAWDLIDRRANAPAVLDHIEMHNTPPPGINFSSAITIGVRRK